MRARNLAYKKAKRSGNIRDWNIYKKKRTALANRLKQAKGRFFNNMDPSNSKIFWKTAKVVTRRIPEYHNSNPIMQG